MTTYDQYQYDESPAMEEQSQTEKAKTNQKNAVTTAIVGTAALGAAAYGLTLIDEGGDNADAVSVTKDDPSADGNGNGAAAATVIQAAYTGDQNGKGSGDGSGDGSDDGGAPRLATGITDDMTFEEAFAAARGELGPGDYFMWRDNYYNTYYDFEWNGMNKTEQDAFVAALDPIVTQHRGTYVAHDSHDSGSHHTAHQSNGHHESHHTAHVSKAAAPAPAPVETEDVSLIADEVEAAEEASVTAAVAQEAAPKEEPSVSVVQVNGHKVSLFDTDHDKQTDMTLADNNVVLLDTDGDRLLDTHGMYNHQTLRVENKQPLGTPIEAPVMNADEHQIIQNDELYTNHDHSVPGLDSHVDMAD